MKLRMLGLLALLSTGVSATAALAAQSDDTLNVAWGADGVMVNVDNYYGATRTGLWFSKLVWDTLVEYDPRSQTFKPSLAETWKWNDPTTLELSLRKGVKFHNGADFTAEDVAYTFNKMSAKDSGVADRGIIDWIDHVEKVDDYTVRIKTKTPFPQALAYLSGALPIYPHEYYEKVGSEGMAREPVGTGPYHAVSIDPGSEYRLEINDDYNWGSPKGTPKIHNIAIRELSDVQTQVAELLSGGIDFTPDLTADFVTKMKGMPGVEVSSTPTLRIHYLAFDVTEKSENQALKDVRVRRAINYAIDREAIVKNLLGGAAKVVDTPCHPLQFGCDTSAAVKYAFDPQKAKELLAEAGLSKGLKLTIYGEPPAVGGDAMIENLRQVGIDATLNRMPYEAYRDLQMAGKAPAVYTNWGSYSLPDASASISFFFKGSEDDFAKDSAVMDLLKAADSEVNETQRKQDYADAIKLITDKAYWVPMFTGVRNYGWSSSLNASVEADELPRLFEFSWK